MYPGHKSNKEEQMFWIITLAAVYFVSFNYQTVE